MKTVINHMGTWLIFGISVFGLGMAACSEPDEAAESADGVRDVANTPDIAQIGVQDGLLQEIDLAVDPEILDDMAWSGPDAIVDADDSEGSFASETVGFDADQGLDTIAPEDMPQHKDEETVPIADDAETPNGSGYTLTMARCGDVPPEGAVLAKNPPTYSGGTCPMLVADGKTPNVILSNGHTRSFLLLAPADMQEGETFPTVVAWHWLKGKAKSFVEQGELESAVSLQRFIAIVPESKNDLVVQIPFVNDPISFPWPIVSLTPWDRFEEEHVFFDDMLACVAEQFPVDKECVTVAGVSAGALYGAQLAAARSQHIASFISLSGGVRSNQPIVNSFLLDYGKPLRHMPMLVLWGGPYDSCALLNFQVASKSLENTQIEAGAVVVECVHNCGHGVPPMEPPPGQSKFTILWEFAFSHPFWLPTGETPWATTLPEFAPTWCAIGAGSAEIRVGPCGEPGCPL